MVAVGTNHFKPCIPDSDPESTMQTQQAHSPTSNEDRYMPVTGPDGKPLAEQLELLHRALPLMTNGVYVQLDHRVQEHCKRMDINLKPKGEPALATWRPKDSLFFTIIKTPSDTVVYCHANDTIYYTQVNLKLSSTCPSYTAFLAQYAEDQGIHGPMARLLVFDILESDTKDARTRNEKLRSMQALLPQPLCLVQWAGEQKALREFVFTLPHKVESLLYIGENPLNVSRSLLLQIPQNTLAKHPVVKLSTPLSHGFL